MRIAGGVLLLIVGLWSLIGGGCSLTAGGLMSAGGKMAKGMDQLQGELAKAAKNMGGKVDDEALKKSQEQLRAAQKKAGSFGSGAMISGIVILVAGILAFIAGIMFFLNKGKTLGFIAVALGVLGEIAFFALLTFNTVGLIKILILGFCGFAATKVGQQA